MDICEEFWNSLDSRMEVPEAQIDAFVDMLLQERSFRLAREVIREFNVPPVDGHPVRSKAEILNRLQQMHGHDFFGVSRPLRSTFADDYYAEERERLTDAEIYRAELLLYNSASMTPQEKEEVRKWLRARPQILDTPHTLASQTKSLLKEQCAQDEVPFEARDSDERTKS